MIGEGNGSSAHDVCVFQELFAFSSSQLYNLAKKNGGMAKHPRAS
jgi:hypothetical protein